MRIPLQLSEEMGSWQIYGDMLLGLAADDLKGDPALIDKLSVAEQFGFVKRWLEAGGLVARCPKCRRVFSGRHTRCPECGGPLHVDDWYQERAERMIGYLARGCK